MATIEQTTERTIPMSVEAANRPATETQLSKLRDLIAQRQVPEAIEELLLSQIESGEMTLGEASSNFDGVRQLPKRFVQDREALMVDGLAAAVAEANRLKHIEAMDPTSPEGIEARREQQQRLAEQPQHVAAARTA